MYIFQLLPDFHKGFYDLSTNTTFQLISVESGQDYEIFFIQDSVAIAITGVEEILDTVPDVLPLLRVAGVDEFRRYLRIELVMFGVIILTCSTHV